MMVAAVLSMVGLFIGYSISATRIPFALAEDGMMPKWLVRVHRKWGTPWVAIIVCGVLFAVFSVNAFAVLVVLDVLLNSLTLLLQFAALWWLRVIKPGYPAQQDPGGWVGLVIVTILPAAVIVLAIYSQVVEEGWRAIWLAGDRHRHRRGPLLPDEALRQDRASRTSIRTPGPMRTVGDGRAGPVEASDRPGAYLSTTRGGQT